MVSGPFWHHFGSPLDIILLSFLGFFEGCCRTRFRSRFSYFSYHIPKPIIIDFLDRGLGNHVFEVHKKGHKDDLKRIWNWCQNDVFSHAKTLQNLNDCAWMFWMPFCHHFWCFFEAFSNKFPKKNQKKKKP
jgi:hypothetical protein